MNLAYLQTLLDYHYWARDIVLDAVTVLPREKFTETVESSFKSLRDIAEKVDMVDVFRKTQDVMPIAEDAIAIGARVLWQQLGVKNEQAAAKARAAGLDAVMDRCVKIEHGRLFGGLNWVGVNTRVISAKRPRWLPY